MRARALGIVVVSALLAALVASPVVAASVYTRMLLDNAIAWRMAMGPDGVHHVITRTTSSTGITHYLADRGNRWTDTLLIGDAADIATDKDGHVYIAIAATASSWGDPLVVLYDDTSGSLVPTTVVAKGDACGVDQAMVSLALASDGTVHVAWSARDAGFVCHRARTAAGWSPAADILDDETPYVHSFDMALDGEGTPHVVVSGVGYPWVGPAECRTGNMVACLVDIALTDTPTTTYRAPVAGYSTDLVLGSAGLEAVVANDTSAVYAGSAGGWTPQTIATANINTASIVSTAGGGLAVYYGDNQKLYRAVRGASAWTSTAITGGKDSWPSAVADAAGDVHIAFTRDVYHADGWRQAAYLLAPDTVKPTVSAPTVKPTRGAVMGSTVPVTVSWSVADALSGYGTATARQQTNGAWATVGTGLTGTSLKRSLMPGSSAYAFAVRATDKAGNTSGYSTGPTFRLTRHQQTSTSIKYGGTWKTVSSTSYSGGSTRYATSTTASATFDFTGRGFAWVGAYGPTRGTAKIWLDGVLQPTVSTYRSSTTSRPVTWSVAWASSGTHRIVIKPAGTSGHPRIDLDALVVIR